jgi:hypothetical protein
MEYIGVRIYAVDCKLLVFLPAFAKAAALSLRQGVGWSGRPGSNPRYPAWEIERELKIMNLAFMAPIECDTDHPVFNGLLLITLHVSTNRRLSS